MKEIRRKDFIINDTKEIEYFINKMNYGHLGLKSDAEYPQVVPLNYVYLHQALYFHSSLKGNKMELINKSPYVSFTITDEYAIIPSWFSDPIKACPATSFFKSAMIYGKASIVTSTEEKAQVLQALMEKLQPEGKYHKIKPQLELYKNSLLSVAVVKIEINQIHAKFKFGQNLKLDHFKHIIKCLKIRDERRDKETIMAMKSFRKD